MKLNFYHCSNKVWNVGDLILPHIDGREYSGGRGIYVTTAPEPHYTLSCNGSNSISKKTRLYRVIPIDNKYHKGDWNDILCPKGVEVVESLGDAPKGVFSYVDKNNIGRLYKSKGDKLIQYHVFVGTSYPHHKKSRTSYFKGFKNYDFAIKYAQKLNKKGYQSGIFNISSGKTDFFHL